MRLGYTRTALRQIDRAFEYVGEHSPQGLAGIRERLETIIALLQEYPHAGQPTSRQGVRRIPLTPYPYVRFYRVTAKAVIVSRFRHAARRPLPPKAS